MTTLGEYLDKQRNIERKQQEVENKKITNLLEPLRDFLEALRVSSSRIKTNV